CFYYRSSRSFTPSDLRLATILADFAATAISSAEAYERVNVLRAVAEESARVVQSVQRITDAALSKLGLQDLLHELLRRVRETLKADVATILLTSESGTELTMSVHEGLDRTWEGPVRMPVGRGIAGTIASTLRATVIDDISKVEVVSEFLRRTVKSLAGVPLLVEGRLIGVLHVATVKPRHFSDQDVQLLQLVGDRVGLAIEQARLFEAEREVRIQAEQARETVAFIAESTRSLSASLNVDETLKRLANLAVPALADLCLIDVVDESGRIRRVTASVSEAHGPILRELEERYPLQDAPRGVMHVITTGETLFVPVVDVSRLSEVAQDARHLELLWQIGPRSYIIVPLITRGRTIGALSVASIEAARTYREEDVIIVEEVARRAAIAIENARLYRAAQEAARQREEFLSIASHELKTPLTTVKGYVQMLERELQRTDLSNDRVRELFGELQGQVRRFEDLVLDLLDASRLQRSRLDLQPEQADLVAILRSVMTRMERSTEFLPSHRLIAEMPESIEGTWDAARLDQVFTNLIANALKYSPQGGDVRVSARQHDGVVEVTVRDSGIGIAEDDFGAIFEPFVRGKVGRRGISGTGLGLYVARQIVEQHGGTISVESALGKGSTFIVRLPMVANTDS
ncbi:MAG TPA: GAF domain-containing sensor histidine kinase, partial [Dehalococcoidia bacterium]|nr:GAF domain-containing sensor histidine kinase [Dehalococcoidia bacterium]